MDVFDQNCYLKKIRNYFLFVLLKTHDTYSYYEIYALLEQLNNLFRNNKKNYTI